METGRDYTGFMETKDSSTGYKSESKPTLRDEAGAIIERSFPIDPKWKDTRPNYFAPNNY